MSKIPPGFQKASDTHTKKVSKEDLDAHRSESLKARIAESLKKVRGETPGAAKPPGEATDPAYKVSIGKNLADKAQEAKAEMKVTAPAIDSPLKKPDQVDPDVKEALDTSPYFNKNPEIQKMRAKDILGAPFLKPEEKKVLSEILEKDQSKK